MRFPLRFLCVLLLAHPVLAASKPVKTARPNIILITLDTTRADRMGFLGSKRGLTPNLDTLAGDGVVFTRAYSQAPLTTVSHATILTGTYPQYHHVNDFGVALSKDLPYLPEILRAQGYETAAFVGSLILDPIEGTAPGFDRGFNTYDAGYHMIRPKQDPYKTVRRRGEEVVARAMAWLGKRSRGPLFLWVHLYDAHDPYDPPEPYKSRYASAPYDGEIAYSDAAIGKVLASLRASGLYNRSIVALMADHGEALGEHGELTHGVFLYDETIHVPLIIKLPAARSAGARIDGRVELVDVMPTVLQAAGIAVPKAVQGRSLMPDLKPDPGGSAASPMERPAYAETDYPRRAFGWSSLRALRSGKYLFVQAPRRELYDQSADAKADHDLSQTSGAVLDTLAEQLIDFRRKTLSAEGAPAAAVDEKQQEKLSALGYVAGHRAGPDVKVGPGIEDTGADPKDKVEIVNLLHNAILAVEATRYREAVPLLEAVLAKESGIPVAYMQLGTSLTWLKEYEKALPVLRKVVEIRPDSLMGHYELGLALSETGDWEGAVPQFAAAVEKSPRWAELHFSLGAAYANIGRTADARKELETTIKLKADNFRAYLALGRLLSLDGKPAEGLPRLKKAVQLRPDAIEAHLFLAEAYAQLGQSANARRERSIAEGLENHRAP